MKKVLVGLLAFTSISSFAGDVSVDCHKIKGNNDYRLIVINNGQDNYQTATLYKTPMNSDESEVILEEDVYMTTSPISSKIAFVLDGETHGEKFELKLKAKLRRGVNQAPIIGKFTSGSIRLRKMDCH